MTTSRYQVRFTRPLLRVWLFAAIAGAYSCLTLLKDRPPFDKIPDVPAALDAALSFSMALLVAFRVNRAYERWWEARILWGTLINVSRNLAIKLKQLHSLDHSQIQLVQKLIVGFCFGLKDHLRDEADLHKLKGFEHDPASPKHVPAFIVSRLYELFAQLKANGVVSDEEMWVVDRESRVLLDVCGGCERIKSTLMSVSWRTFTYQCIVTMLIIFPWGLVDDFGYWTPALCIIASYLLIAGEVIARFVEEPFGKQIDHLDLERMCHIIDTTVTEVLELEE